MSDAGFDADWLVLREPVDHRSRARSLVNELRQEGVRRGWTRLVDLGSGTGSNLRYVSARVPWAREWTAVDHDAELLESVTSPSPAHSVRRVHGDLSRDGLEAVGGSHVVTASALLDLVSEAWLRELRDRVVEAGAAVYVALSYDGAIQWTAEGADGVDPVAAGIDALVRDAVNEHQRTDKGLGTALGPDATEAAERLFREVGWEIRTEPSPWVLRGPDDERLLARLVEGWVEAAVEMRPEHGLRIRAWGEGRIRDVVTGAVTLRVGHRDLLALPPAPTRERP